MTGHESEPDELDLSRSEANCRAKTAKRNVFRIKNHAKWAASRHRRRTGCRAVVWYRCRHCHLYHIGTRRSHDEQVARAWERIERELMEQVQFEWESWWETGMGKD